MLVFSISGSFVLALNTRDFAERHETQIARSVSFLSNDEKFRGKIDKKNIFIETSKLKFNDWTVCANQFLQHEQMFCDVLTLAKIALRRLNVVSAMDEPQQISSILFDLVDVSSGRVGDRSALGALLHSMKNADSIKLLEILQAWREELRLRLEKRKTQRLVHDTFLKEDSNYIDEVCEKINENVILLQEMLLNRVDLKEAVHLDLVSWFYALLKSCSGEQVWMVPSEVNPSISYKELCTYIQSCVISCYSESSIEAQPRRIVASALALPQLFIKCKCCHENEDNLSDVQENMEDSCIAFKTLKSRKIDCSDWFCSFLDSKTPSNDRVTSWFRFAFSVYELSFCGLIRKVDDSVEKIAMVWANG